MHYTYILISKNRARTYTGVTSNIKRRLKEHNSGKGKFTKPYSPFSILYLENYSTRKEAYQREAYFKSTPGKREISQLLKGSSEKI